MSANYNSKAFVPEEVTSGALQDLINYLLSYNNKSHDYYYDIHITTDGYCTIVEWTDRAYDSSIDGGGSFQFVDYDEQIMREIILPDNSIEFILPDEDEKEYIKEWEREHGNDTTEV